MKCYNHPETDAVAICKNCYKAICIECIIELKNGVACKNSKDNCEIEVQNLNRYLDTYKIASQRTKINFSRNIIFVGILGLSFLIVGLLIISNNFIGGILPIVIGLAFSSIAVMNIFEKKKYDKLNK